MKPTGDSIALVGAGDRGLEILTALLDVPGVEIRYLLDADAAAPGIALARENGIRCITGGGCYDLSAKDDVDLILETTGRPDVVAALAASKHPATHVVDAAGVSLVARLLEAQRETAAGLEEQVLGCERRIADLTEVVDREPVERACYVRQASHQIKSPLSSIQSYVNVILGGYTGELPERTREVMEKIHARCEAALDALAKCRMLADLRCVGRGGLEMSTASLGELAAQAIECHGHLAAERGIEVHLVPHDGPDLVSCDASMMVTLLAELVENAVIYSNDGGVVEISVAAPGDDRLAVSVRDQGIGIPERCLPRIFDEDYRADPAKQHHADGDGVGLTIAREIADFHGFELRVESEEGHGSVFTVTAPAAPAA